MESIDWKNLEFGYSKTDYNVRSWFRNGAWGKLEVSDSEMLNIHMAATSLHYGQEAFEGLKAFRGKDGKIRVFRMLENARRMQRSAKGIMMAEVPESLFAEAVKKAVLLNERFVPPYESGASLYIRPLLIGTGAQIGVKPADEFLFMIFVMPVGPYFKEGFKPTDLVIYREYDPANFFGIKGNSYITPKSSSILPSITNMSLRQLAADMGLQVEVRPVPVEELAGFDEIGACGTAAVISPIKRVYDSDLDKEYNFGTEPGKISRMLYEKLRGIQYG